MVFILFVVWGMLTGLVYFLISLSGGVAFLGAIVGSFVLRDEKMVPDEKAVEEMLGESLKKLMASAVISAIIVAVIYGTGKLFEGLFGLFF